MALMAVIKADLMHSAALWGLPPRRALRSGLTKVLLYPRVRAVLVYRLSHAMWPHRRARAFALLLQNYAIRSSGAEIHPAALIGPGLSLVHSNGVVIGAKTRIGANARIYQQVTIGDDGRRVGQPTIGDGAILGAGCKVLGPISLGESVTIAANAVVLNDVDDAAVVAGVPGQVVRQDRR